MGIELLPAICASDVLGDFVIDSVTVAVPVVVATLRVTVTPPLLLRCLPELLSAVQAKMELCAFLKLQREILLFHFPPMIRFYRVA